MIPDAELKELIEEYRRDAWARLAEVDRLLVLLARDPQDADALDSLRRRFHAFAGSGRSHGYGTITDDGRKGERICALRLEGGEPLRREGLDALAAARDAIAAALAG
jgi:chemotaxis protein histidine kinase CheA